MYIFLIALLACSASAQILSVDNGGPWGTWGEWEICDEGSHVVGYSLKMEPKQGSGDDSALNQIELLCSNQEAITSLTGPWGSSGPYIRCPNQRKLVRFSLQVEPKQGGGDDSAANSVRFVCSGGQVIGHSGFWGTFGSYSEQCAEGLGICGLKTRVEAKQGGGDDSALNDVKFICC